jgi:hypothetical protein
MADEETFGVPGELATTPVIYAQIRRLAEQYDELRKQQTELPHVHVWETLGIWRPTQPIHPRIRADYTTTVLLRCVTCHWPETSELDGIWTEEQVRKASSNE